MSEKEPVRRLEKHIDVDAPIEEAWKAITTSLGITSWFASSLRCWKASAAPRKPVVQPPPAVKLRSGILKAVIRQFGTDLCR